MLDLGGIERKADDRKLHMLLNQKEGRANKTSLSIPVVRGKSQLPPVGLQFLDFDKD